MFGSDRRVAAYGCTELSRAPGVSPWARWAGVPTSRRGQFAVAAAWRPVAVLAWSGRAVTTLPATADVAVRPYLLPTLRLTPDGARRVRVTVDAAPPTELDVPVGTRC